MTVRSVSLVLLGAGAVLAAAGLWQWWDGERIFARMRRTTCTVVSRKVEATLLVKSRRRSVTPPTASIREEARLEFAHTLEGRQRRFSEEFEYDWAEYAKAGYEEGKSYPCRYDPEDPARGTIRNAFDPTDAQDNLAFALVAMLLGAVAPRMWGELTAHYSRR